MSPRCSVCEKDDALMVLPPGISGRPPKSEKGRESVLICVRCDGVSQWAKER